MTPCRASLPWRALGALALVLPMLAVGGSTLIAAKAAPRASSLTGPLAADLGAPAVVATSAGKTDLWTRTSAGVAQHRGRTNWGWTPNQSLGAPGMLYSAPFAASSGSGSVSAFVQGPYGEVYAKTAPVPGAYSGWAWLAGKITGRPAAASPSTGRFDVFGRSTSGTLWTRSADSSGQRYGWFTLGGGLATGSGPGAASTQGRTTVVIRGTDNSLWMRTRYTSGSYSAWAALGGKTNSDPAVASSAAGRLDIFVRGLDNALWHRSAGTSNTAWERLGGGLSSGPSASAPAGGGTVTVVVRGAGGSTYYSGTYSPSGTWVGWSVVSHSGVLGTSPSWNSHVPCKAVVTSIQAIVGAQASSRGGGTFDGGRFNPSIPDADRAAAYPACSVDGQGMLVEVHRVKIAVGCGGGTPDGDWSCNIYDPSALSTPYSLRAVHTEIIGAWGPSGWNPGAAPVGTLIDIQGFIWWDPTHTDADWHLYSGWEIHPFTAWRTAR